MGFAKLESGIVDSSLWNEPCETRVVWITMLAKSDENGLVACSRSGLMRAANLPTTEAFDQAITTLESPDADSRSREYDGRRVERVDGGWLILNYERYRARSEVIRSQTRDRVRRLRAKKGSGNVTVTQCNACNANSALPSVSVSVSESESASASESGPTRDTRPPKKDANARPTIEDVRAYCKERGNDVDAEQWIDHYTSNGWKVGRNPMRDWRAAVRTWEKSTIGTTNQQSRYGPRPFTQDDFRRQCEIPLEGGDG